MAQTSPAVLGPVQRQVRPAVAVAHGSDEHLTLIGAPWHWNLLHGVDRADMLAFGRACMDAERERWEGAMRDIVCGDAGTQVRHRLEDGQGVNTQDGQAWMRALQMLGPKGANVKHALRSFGHCWTCNHDKIPGESCARHDCPETPNVEANRRDGSEADGTSG